MPTQKVFKQRVRTRMAKTGESYTAARHQLLRKSTQPEPPADAALPTTEAALPTSTELPTDVLLVADESMRRATGKGHAEWFALLDGWGATDHTHTEIARWLSEVHGVPGWWRQNVTVAYERARGMRVRHQMRDGFSISVTRTIAAEPARALAAFTAEGARQRWLPAAMHQRPTRAALTARFDWPEPTSRVVVTIVAKDPGKSLVSVAHEQLPDAEMSERLKSAWRGWLDELRVALERTQGR